MKIITKLATALRGRVREAAESVVDANSLRIFEQEIHDCELTIHQAKHDLCDVMAQIIKLKQDSKPLRATIELKEVQAVEAFRLQEHDLVEGLVQLIAHNEQVVEDLGGKLKELQAYEARLKQSLITSVRQVQDYRRELRVAQVTVSADKAIIALTVNTTIGTNQLKNLADSLARIKQQQRDVSIRIEASEQLNAQLSDNGLEQQLKAAGISKTTDLIKETLKRIRDKASRCSNSEQ
jgi:phage shock protein A